MKKALFTFGLLSIISCNDQAQNEYLEKLLETPKVGQKFQYKDSTSIRETTYLGQIKGKNGETIYHVLKEFYLVEAIITGGHSKLFFFDENKNLVGKYSFELPEDIPNKLIDNTLYFEYSDKKENEKVHTVKIGKDLPQFLCIQPDDCFFKETK